MITIHSRFNNEHISGDKNDHFNEHENLHFDNEQDSHISSKHYEKNDSDLDLDLLITL